MNDLGMAVILGTKNAPTAKAAHFKRNLAIAVGLCIVLVFATLTIIGYFTLVGCFGCGLHPVVSTNPLCSVANKSCEILLLNTGDVNAQAIGCTFQSRGAPGSSNATVEAFTVEGVLSYKTGGPAITIFIPAGGSVTVYCSGYSGYLEPGVQVDGAVQTADGNNNPFSTTWHT
jgi:hypothetical protein